MLLHRRFLFAFGAILAIGTAIPAANAQPQIGVVPPPQVYAQPVPGYTTATLNLRAGDGTYYPVVAVMPRSANVVVYSCSRTTSWCYLQWQGLFGWASANYLVFSRQPPAQIIGPPAGGLILPRPGYRFFFWF